MVQSQRIILKNAALDMTVEDPAQVVTQVTQLVESTGGWIVNSNLTTETQGEVKTTRGTLSGRVPADKLVTILDQIKASALSIQSETITGDDVTDKYVDLNSQLTNLQNTEAQLQKIMLTAKTVGDVLAVQSQLTGIQGQIEQIKGQLQYFNQAAAYSLINLNLSQKPPQEKPVLTPTPEPPGLPNWRLDQTASQAISSLIATVQTLISLLIWLVIDVGPFAIVAILVFLVARRRFRQRKRTTDTSSNIPTSAP